MRIRELNFFVAISVTILGGPASEVPNVLGAEPGMAARFPLNGTAPGV
jgi:hypothetical protein